MVTSSNNLVRTILLQQLQAVVSLPGETAEWRLLESVNRFTEEMKIQVDIFVDFLQWV